MRKMKTHGFRFLEHCEPYFVAFHNELYYDLTKKKWVSYKEYTGDWYPASFPCRSLKAAKRHLRKHNEIPRGTRFVLVSRYIGYNIYLTKK